MMLTYLIILYGTQIYSFKWLTVSITHSKKGPASDCCPLYQIAACILVLAALFFYFSSLFNVLNSY